MTRPPQPPSKHEGFEYRGEPERGWRLVEGKRCRMFTQFGGRACGRPSVAELNRRAWQDGLGFGRVVLPNWWAYCEDHLYDRWVEDGQVMHWVLREATR